MRSASQSAMALARGELVSPASSRITEIDDLSTGLRLAAETLDARNRERDEASRLKDEFLMTVSHELRTPLTAIYGWARMLSTGQIRDAQRPRAIDAIERNAAALQQLVNDLLDVSRVVSGRLRLDVQPVSLPDVVGAAIDAIRPAAHAKNISVGHHGRRRPVGLGRRRTAAAGGLEPAVQRRPLHAAGRTDRDRGRPFGRRSRARRPRHRPRRRRVVPAARLRALPPGRGRHHARARRPRSRAGDRPPPRRAARRHRRGVEQRARAGRDVPRRAARAVRPRRRRSAAASRPPRGWARLERRRGSTASACWSPTTT